MNKRYKLLLLVFASLVVCESVKVFVFGGTPLGAQHLTLLTFVVAWGAEKA